MGETFESAWHMGFELGALRGGVQTLDSLREGQPTASLAFVLAAAAAAGRHTYSGAEATAAGRHTYFGAEAAAAYGDLELGPDIAEVNKAYMMGPEGQAEIAQRTSWGPWTRI